MSLKESAADGVDRARLVEDFLRLAQINGPSYSEHDVAAEIQSRLEAMGFVVQYDNAAEALGGTCSNMFAWWEGTDPNIPPMFFSTHLDTVLPTQDLKPVVREDVIYSDGTTILGADDRAALAAYLEGIRVVQEHGMDCGPIELILTVAEQVALLGARNLDFSKVRSQKGYIFDSSGDVGQIILKGPYGKLLRWRIQGKKAHVGLSPEEGINAIQIAAEGVSQMRLGRIDDQTNANLGIIHGGQLASIVPDEVEMVGEVRSFSREKMDEQVQHMVDVVANAASRFGATVQVEREKKYDGYDILREADHTQIAVHAAERIGVQPYFTETLGGADTNIFIENGLTVMTLGNGFRNIHSFDEHISIQNLVNTGRYVVALIEEYVAAHSS